MKPKYQSAINKANSSSSQELFYIKPPVIPDGVVPDGIEPPVVAMDTNPYQLANQMYGGYDIAAGFPGFSYLSQLATRLEYRAFASALSTELTREWIEFTSDSDDGEAEDKIKRIEDLFDRLKIRQTIQRCAEMDCLFGRAQIFIDTGSDMPQTPLVLNPKVTNKLKNIIPIEPIWTTPSVYNAIDPLAPDFFSPSKWYMLGKEVHASRLITIVTRPLPDILKPAFNFSGISLSQLAEPYVENWLRTRQSVSDLIANFSITGLATAMDQVLQGDDDGADLFARAELFTSTRSNKGLMLLDKEREEMFQFNTPIGGLSELQAQSQEHMCTASRIPAVILTGLSPTGLNASSEGEIRVFYDWIAAQQEAYWRDPIQKILNVVQLSLFGDIDKGIGFEFKPLHQMTEAEQATIRAQDVQSAIAYIQAGVLDPSEERRRIAADVDSGYQGLDIQEEHGYPDEEERPEGESLIQPNKVIGQQGTQIIQGENENNGESIRPEKVLLNGAQISSIIEVSKAVAAGSLTREAGINIMILGFPLDEEQASKIIADPKELTNVEEKEKQA
jgi:phage-related protein (TIGR01555 family)